MRPKVARRETQQLLGRQESGVRRRRAAQQWSQAAGAASSDEGGRLLRRHDGLAAGGQVQDATAHAAGLAGVVGHPHSRRAALLEHRLRNGGPAGLVSERMRQAPVQRAGGA